MEPCKDCGELHGKISETQPHKWLSLWYTATLGVPSKNAPVLFARWRCDNCEHHMIRNTEGESGNNRWAIADFPQSVDYEADGCIFWTDARQQTDGLFRGGVHVVSIDDDPVDPAVFIPAKSLFSSLEEAQEDADAFAFEIAGDGRMRSEVLAKRK